MRRALLMALGLLVLPALAQAQVEIGLDGGLMVQSTSGANTDNPLAIDIPMADMRLGFAGGESLVVETILGASYYKVGDVKTSWIDLVPGVNYIFNGQVYVRGEGGLLYNKYDNGTDPSSSTTQFLLGGAVGTRKMLSEGALLRLEAGVDRAFEKKDAGVVTIPASWNFRVVVGLSAVVGG